MTIHWSRGIAAFAVLLVSGSARSAPVEGPGAGSLMGMVEDSRGFPLQGAVISLFGRGLAGGGLVTLSDSAGRFALPALPPGSYTLRALRNGHRPAVARRVQILPNQDANFTISLAALEAAAAARRAEEGRTDEDEAQRELRWLLRHKRRSALEDRDSPSTAAEQAPTSPRLLSSIVQDLDGTLEVLAVPLGPPADASDTLPGLGLVRLRGRITDSARWTVGGLVAERDGSAWRVAGEFVVEGAGHEVQMATGYGTGPRSVLFAPQAPMQERGIGVVRMQDTWRFGEGVSATVGGRYSYAGFLAAANHLDPEAAIELCRDERVRLRATVGRRTVLPGGDVLMLSGVSSAASSAFAVMDDMLRPERLTRGELAVEEDVGPFTFEARTFYEGVEDQLVHRFARGGAELHIANGGAIGTRGMGLRISRRFGNVLHGSMSYTYGRGRRPNGAIHHELAWRGGDFHDVAARVETFIQGTDTRLMAFWRVNRLTDEDEQGPGAGGTHTRFDLQLSQGLPFLGALTRADWDVLVAVRNVFYEANQGGMLDEVTVVDPPKRVLGGISVRF